MRSGVGHECVVAQPAVDRGPLVGGQSRRVVSNEDAGACDVTLGISAAGRLPVPPLAVDVLNGHLEERRRLLFGDSCLERVGELAAVGIEQLAFGERLSAKQRYHATSRPWHWSRARVRQSRTVTLR